MADGVPRERRATPCRCDGSDRRPTDHTVDLEKQITALADRISQLRVILATLTKSVDDKILAKQQQIGRGCEQRRGDREYSQRHTQRRRHRRHGHSSGRCYGCGQFGHFRRECTRFVSEQSREHARASRYSGNGQEIHSTGCATSHLHGGCTTGSRSDAQRQSDTRWQHVRCVKTYEPTRATRSRNAVSPINREHMCSATCSAITGWSSRRDAGEPHLSALISRIVSVDIHKRRQVKMRYGLLLCRHILIKRNHTLSLTRRHTRILSSMTL